jgi:hypothetical protein
MGMLARTVGDVIHETPSAGVTGFVLADAALGAGSLRMPSRALGVKAEFEACSG